MIKPFHSKLGDLNVGEGFPVAVGGIINLSPESFYKGSVKQGREEILSYALKLEEKGADFIDVGAVSTAPTSIYGSSRKISLREEIERVKNGLEAFIDEVKIPVSIDTQRSRVASLALEMGAKIVNDVSGFKSDPEMPRTVAEHGASAIIMACRENPGDVCRLSDVIGELEKSLSKALGSGVKPDKIVVDPGIGFGKSPRCDLNILKNLKKLYFLEKPVLVSVSRKNFIGVILGGVPPEKRLTGSISAVSIAVFNGAHAVRTHDVAETIEAVRVAEEIRGRMLKFKGEEEMVAQKIDWVDDLEDAERLIRKIGVEREAVKCLKEKAVFHLLTLKNVPVPAALILKQSLLALGGDAAIHKDTVNHGVEKTDVLIMATRKQIRKTAENARKQRFKLSIISRLLLEAIS